MSRELKETTSRRAIILGMTNTDQVGMWQAPPRAAAAARQEAEVLPDAGDGADAGDGDSGEERNENGLTAAEQAEFDGMRTGEPPPAGDEPPPESDDGDSDGDPDEDGDPEPEPEPAPQQRLNGEKPPAQQEQKPPPKTVNYSKYQRELKRANEARTAAEAQLAKAREDQIKLATRVEMINEALQQRPAAKQEEPEAPVNPFEEPDIDPDEDFKGAVAQVNRRVKFQQEVQQQTQEVFQESREDSAIKETFTRDFSAYASKEPAIHGAYQHLKDARLTQICLGEFGKDPNDVNEQFTPQEVARMVQMFNNEEKWLVGKAIKEKRSPAAAIMSMAKTFGFDPAAWKAAQEAARQPAPAARAPAAGPPQVPAPVAPRVPAPRQAPAQQQEMSAQDALEQLRVNQENGRSLSDGGGAPPPSGLSAEMILRLGDAEFAELLDSMPEHQLNAIMGRARAGES